MNFMDALNTEASAVEKPPVLPRGTYTWKVTKAHSESKAAGGKWDVVTIPVVPVAADEDVDPDMLAQFGDLKQGTNSIRFMFPTDPAERANFDRTLFNLKNFLLSTLQVDGNESMTLKQLLGKIPGCEFKGQADHRVDGENIFVDIKSLHAVA